ncbi:MAG: phosphoribosyltransferase [Ottowia sp.]|nr:phosphoribosyltransferase [Ottowia sp.]
MTMNSGHLWISWDKYHRLIDLLAVNIHQSNWHFDHILCLARGGLRVGDQLSRIFNVPLAILSTRSYVGEAGEEHGELVIASSITSTVEPLAGRILLVDDLVDSGITLHQVCRHIPARHRQISEMRTAVLWWKSRSHVVPDYFVEYLPTNPWVHQPFEIYDQLQVQDIEQGQIRG